MLLGFIFDKESYMAAEATFGLAHNERLPLGGRNGLTSILPSFHPGV